MAGRNVDGLFADLRGVVGAAHVLTDPQVTAGYCADWTGAWTGTALAVVRPADTEQVAAVLRLCATAGVQVTVQGGNTGLVGGAVPDDTLLLSTTRMTDIGVVDAAVGCVAVCAGATIAAVDAAARSAGLMAPIDLAARESATLGGAVATNAGGVRFIRHGGAREQILGMVAVLADGTVIRRMSPLPKDNVGYDLPGLFAGSEGTLAVITEVLVRLVPPLPAGTVTAVIGVETVAAAVAVLRAAQRAGLTVEAAELMTEAGLDLVVESAGLRRPFAESAPFAALLEVSAAGDADAATATMLRVLDEADILDAVLESHPARALWLLRESHTEAIAAASASPVVKLDVSVPLSSLDEAFERVTAECLVRGGRPVLFGHFGDGNIHVNCLDVPQDERAELVEQTLHIIADLAGSISAEHGIGKAKARWLALGRSAPDIAAMRAVKEALDPQGLLNPGVIFERS